MGLASTPIEPPTGAEVTAREPLEPVPGMPRIGSRTRINAGEIAIGEWSITAAAYTDLHMHDEINYVLEGELHVTCDGETHVVTAGDVVTVRAGTVGRYAAPTYARMMYVYGPSSDGHAAIHRHYEEF